MDSMTFPNEKEMDTRADYEEKLVWYNRQLADARSRYFKLEAASDQAEGVYAKAREERDAVRHVYSKLIVKRQSDIDECEAEKKRLIAKIMAHKIACEKVNERRQLQYEQALEELESKRMFVEGKYMATSEKQRRRNVLMDKVTQIQKIAEDFVEKRHEGLFYSGQKIVCKRVKVYQEQENDFANMVKTVILNHGCDQTDVLRNLCTYNDILEEINETRKLNSKTQKEFHLFVERNADKKIDMYSETDQIKIFQSLKDEGEKKVKSLIEKIAIVKLDKERLMEEDSKQKMAKEVNLKYIQAAEELENSISINNNILKEINQEIVTINEAQKKKCNYIKKITNNIELTAEELEKYATGKKSLGNNCVLEIIRRLVNFKIVSACK